MREAPGFDDPVGLLAVCHGRIRDRCAMLVRLPAHLQANGPDVAARRREAVPGGAPRSPRG